MRNLQFRVWDGKKMEYSITAGYYGVFFVNPENGDGLNPKDIACLSENTTIYPDDIPVMLWSGFTDPLGTEIYAKDIIRFAYEDKCEDGGIGYCFGVVEFENGCFVVKEPNFTYDKHCMPQTLREWLRDEQCEVIGNVYENKEYLDN